MATESEIAEVLALLAAAYPRTEIPETTARLYRLMLSDIPGESLKAAAIHCVRTSKWFPTVAELVDACYGLSKTDTSAEEAWGMVLQRLQYPETIFRDGKRLRLKPLSPEIEEAVRIAGGWTGLRMSEMIAPDRKRFIDAYNAILDRKKRELTEHPLIEGMKAKWRLGDGRS